MKVKAHLEALQVENDHLSREIAILRETVKVNLHISLKSERTITCWDSTAEMEEKKQQLDENTILVLRYFLALLFKR